MKNRWSVCACWLFLSLLLAGCAKHKRLYVIGVSQCSQDEWREKQNEEMQREASLMGNLLLEMRSVRDDSHQQVRDIDYFISKKVDLLVVSPNEAHAVTPAVERAYKAGIPVVVIDRKIEGSAYHAFVGADNVQIGHAMGHYVRSLKQRPLRIFEIGGLAGSTPAMERTEGLHHVIDSLKGVTLVGRIDASWRLEEAETKMDSVFAQHDDIDLIVSQNDRMAFGARRAAIKRNRMPRLGFIGVDALTAQGLGVDAVMKGELNASFIYPTGGDKVIQTALQILQGKPYARETILFSAQVDSTNARIMKMQGQMLSEQTATVNRLVKKLDVFLERYNTQTLLLWAVMLILLLLVIVCLFVINAYRNKVRINGLLKQTTREKLAFFTNVSHDFRTPLTLIADPVNQLMTDATLDEKQRYLLGTVQRNVTVLLRLINQVLDFRKWESGKLAMRIHEFDLAEGIREWSEVFKVLANRRHIHFEVECGTGEVRMIADREKMERILYNLLSNAFKFTPDGGTVRVNLSAKGEEIALSVSDTGMGMPATHVSHIFENFYQVGVHHSGSGIGLALVKAFVEMHHGKIQVESHEDEGTIFTIRMPLRQAGTLDEAVQQNVALEVMKQGALAEASSAGRADSAGEQEAESDKPLVQVIDDNGEVRSYIRYLLQEEYRIQEAADGREGLEMAVASVPDAIICDVMMPVMDGMECCRRLKEDVRTSHIPVMMLTAYAQDEQKIEGYNCGADSYIAKPFSAPLLKSRLHNLLEGRRKLQQLYASMFMWSPAEDSSDSTAEIPASAAEAPSPAAETSSPTAGVALSASAVLSSAGSSSEAVAQVSFGQIDHPSPVGERLTSSSSPLSSLGTTAQDLSEQTGEQLSAVESLTLRDREFLSRFRQLVDEHLSDSNLNVEVLGSELGLSRVQLYRKLKALTGSSPVEQLRTIRLHRAKALLATSGMSVSEVAYAVGFSSPSYFTKCYKEAFGTTPTSRNK